MCGISDRTQEGSNLNWPQIGFSAIVDISEPVKHPIYDLYRQLLLWKACYLLSDQAFLFFSIFTWKWSISNCHFWNVVYRKKCSLKQVSLIQTEGKKCLEETSGTARTATQEFRNSCSQVSAQPWTREKPYAFSQGQHLIVANKMQQFWQTR